MNRLVIVRHGNTFAPGDIVRRIGARTDLPLVDEGRAQARRLGRHLRGCTMAFGTVFAGRLARARETAGLILAEGNWPMAWREVDWLNEIDHGPDEGQIESAVLRRIGQAALDAWDTRTAPPPGWVVDVEIRLAAWRTILQQPPPGDSLLVTSNGAARFALEALRAPSSFSRRLRTGAFGLLERNGPTDGLSWKIVAWDVQP